MPDSRHDLRQLSRRACLACAVAVLVLALLPPASAEVVSLGWDKANHALAFLVLGALARYGFDTPDLTLFAALLAFGLAIEVLQGMTPYRSAQAVDVLADAVGVALAWPLARFARRGR